MADMVINLLAVSRHCISLQNFKEILSTNVWVYVLYILLCLKILHCTTVFKKIHHNNHTQYKVISHQLSKISRRWTAVLLVFPERTELLFPSTKISSNLSLVSPEFPPFPTLEMIGLILSAGFPTFATKI